MWIGDAFVLDVAASSLDDSERRDVHSWGPFRALWCRDDARALARVTIVKAMTVAGLGENALVVDDEEEEAAARAANARNRVPVLGVYARDGKIARVEADVGDLSLHEVARVFTEGGHPPAGLSQYIEREKRARGFHPPMLEDWRAVVVAWDGTLWWRARPSYPDWWPIPLDDARSPFLATGSGPFGAAELAGMLRGLLPDQFRACALEREERVHTALPPKDSEGSAARSWSLVRST